jgi:hypothetical protein
VAKCEACGKELAADAHRFCSEECRRGPPPGRPRDVATNFGGVGVSPFIDKEGRRLDQRPIGRPNAVQYILGVADGSSPLPGEEAWEDIGGHLRWVSPPRK